MSRSAAWGRVALATDIALALRNLRRNLRRTVLTVGTLAVAIGALTYMLSLTNGYLINMRDNVVRTLNGHVQIYRQGFKDSGLIDDYMADPAPVLAMLAADPNVIAWTARVQASGLASVAATSAPVGIIGIDPQSERSVSRLHTFLAEGEWLGTDPRAVLLGKDVAENLDVGIGDRVVLMTQAPGGDIESEAFRVRGILRSGVPDVDRVLALAPLATVQSWLALGRGVTEIVVLADAYESVDPLADRLRVGLGSGSFDVRRWYDADPLIKQILQMQDASIAFLVVIVVVVVIGQLVNTMFMSLHDRVRELGLMAALGSRRANLFAMLSAEAAILVGLGGAVGYAVAAAFVGYYGAKGIDLTAFTETLGSMYMDPIVRPVMDLRSTLWVVGALAATAVLAGIVPAWQATRLNPVEAMRQV